MGTPYRMAGRGHGGRKRPTNEDHVLVDPAHGLAIVADGMGGERGGEIAARIACDAIADFVRAGTNYKPLLRRALDAAAHRVQSAARESAAHDRMGTTIAAIRVIADSALLEIAHVGDVRVYVHRRVRSVPLLAAAPSYCPQLVSDASVLVCVTRDHSPLCELVERGHVDRSLVRKHPLRGKVSRILGHDEDVAPDLLALHLVLGDRVMICSDGLWDVVDAATIGGILDATRDPDAACDELVAATLAAGAPDNIAVAVLDWGEAPRRAHEAMPKIAGEVAGQNERRGAAPLAGVLAELGRDLNAAAARGELDPVIGREREVRELGRVLAHRRKSNALLIGEPGVGKTSIVEGLAQRLAAGNVAEELSGLRLISIPINDLIAGTKYRGDLESRIKDLIHAAEDRSIVLFLDELHAAVSGSGESAAAVIANALKPALARGTIRLIGATTRAEYERHLAPDEALTRRFEIIEIAEPTKDDTLAIVRGLRPRLAAHYRVTLADEALDAAVELADRFLPDRRYPDKAIDLLDHASSRLRLRTLSRHEHPSLPTIGRREIAEAVAERARIAVDVVLRDPRQPASDLVASLRSRIKGQDDALAQIAAAIRRRQLGVDDPMQPISMLFTGPTGVGKSATARALAELVFGRANALVKLDMSEYAERHSVSRLLGAPPGYVGHGEEGQLTGPVRRQPACVVLFDEIDKAHPDVLLVLLQILQDGVVTDTRGHVTSFRETIVVMTANLSVEPVAQRIPGFHAADQPIPTDEIDAARRKALTAHLRPELVGRIGGVVPFRALDGDDIAGIIDLVVGRIEDRLRSQGVAAPDRAGVRVRVGDRVNRLPFGVRQLARIAEEEVGRALDAASVAAVSDRVLLDTTRTRGLAAMLVIDVVGSTRFLHDRGDTAFSDFIAQLIRACRTHTSSADLQHLKCIGDGVFCCYGSVDSAIDMGRDIVEIVKGSGVPHLRRVVHYGRLRHGPDGERLGLEVHHLFRIEAASNDALPAAPFVVSSAARDKLAEVRRAHLVHAGAFQLTGFADAADLWLYREGP